MIRNQKRGQVTIFIIIAIAIIALGILAYLFIPGVRTTIGTTTDNPEVFIQDCIEEELESVIERVSVQGGSLNPGNSYLYMDEQIEYLCYTSEYYVQCAVQQPMLKQHIEREIRDGIERQSDTCFSEMVNSFESRGYSVNLQSGTTKVELLPKTINVNFDRSLSLSKDETQNFDSITVDVNNNLYELISIANSIVNMETQYGDSETTIYMNYYKDLKVEKKKQSDGTTIYILTNRNTGDKFQFASRSVAWPPGISA